MHTKHKPPSTITIHRGQPGMELGCVTSLISAETNINYGASVLVRQHGVAFVQDIQC